MNNLQSIVDISIIGLALSSILYWVAILCGRITVDRSFFKWWLQVVVIQGITIAAALKLIGII